MLRDSSIKCGCDTRRDVNTAIKLRIAVRCDCGRIRPGSDLIILSTSKMRSKKTVQTMGILHSINTKIGLRDVSNPKTMKYYKRVKNRYLHGYPNS